MQSERTKRYTISIIVWDLLHAYQYISHNKQIVKTRIFGMPHGNTITFHNSLLNTLHSFDKLQVGKYGKNINITVSDCMKFINPVC